MKICIIGAGLGGLVAGYRLSQGGHDVTVVEKDAEIGGQLKSFRENGDSIPITYHHILKTDSHTRGLIKELGLWDSFYKKKTSMGFLYDDRIYNFTSPVNVLGFKPLSRMERLRFILFGIGIYLRRDWKSLERVTVEDWMGDSNRGIYEKIFKPLLKIKFSKDHGKIIARWVGERLKMGESSGPMGYLEGGLEQILTGLRGRIEENGGRVLLKSSAVRFSTIGGRVRSVTISDGKKLRTVEVDVAIYTGPVHNLPSIVKLPEDYGRKLKSIRYKSTLCASIGLDRPITDYYWINMLNGDYSFGGIIVHSNLNSNIKSAKSMIYVFTYLDKEDRFWKMSDSEILNRYIDDVDRIFKIKGNVKWKRLNRVENSKPLYNVAFNDLKLDFKTPIPNLYLGGITLFYPKIRNMGTAIETGEKIARMVQN